MAKTIAFSLPALGANTIVGQVADIQNSKFNPAPFTADVAMYAKSDQADSRFTFSLGDVDQSTDDILPQTAGSLSTQDHLVGTGTVLKGDKMTVGIRTVTAGAIVGRLVLTRRV